MSAMFSDNEAALLEILQRALPGLSTDALQIFWRAFKTEAIHRLAVERKPLDLGFVEVIPVPWRQNWKDALLAKFRQPFTRLQRRDLHRADEELAARGFHEAMTGTLLLAIDRHRKFIRWTVECIPSDELTSSIDEHEAARKEKFGDLDYTASFMEDLKNYIPDALRIMARYTRRAIMPRGYAPARFLDWILSPFDETEGRRKVNPSRDPENARDPSTVCQADKSTQSPDTNNHTRLFGKAPDPLPEEPADGTGAASG